MKTFIESPHQRRNAFIVCGLVYLLALVVAIIAGWLVRELHPLVIVLIADIAGTCVIFAFSRLLNNASMYDPYWSVAPMVIALFWLLGPYAAETMTLRHALVMFVVLAWGLRLTSNWARRWQGLKHEDWRYRDLRKRTGKAFPLVDFFGIEMMPTLVVFLGCLSLYPVLTNIGSSFGVLDIIALLIAGTAISIETIADRQMSTFLATNAGSGRIMEDGLWAFSRHPNYFGEILFWWGLFFFALAASASNWWTITGPLAITCLFVFISIPMMEKRNILRRPEYMARRGHISSLVPWFPAKREGTSPYHGQDGS